MNVAFRGADEQAQYNLDYTNPSPYPPSGKGAWFEDRQAAALAGRRHLRLRLHRQHRRPARRRDPQGPDRPRPARAGLHLAVHRARGVRAADREHELHGVKGRGSGGAASAFAQVFNLLGPYQPYGVYVPRSVPTGRFGAADGVARQQPGHRRPDQPAGHAAAVRRGPRPAAGDARGPRPERLRLRRQRARPARRHGRRRRGPSPSTTERVFSSGYSQGGYITFRMAFLFPELFAGFTGWVPFTGDDTNGTPGQGTGGGVTAGAVGNMIDFVGNARHVPGSMIFGAEDELVPGAQRRGDAGGVRRGRGPVPVVDARAPRSTSRSRPSTTGRRRRPTRPTSGGCTTRRASPSGRRPSSTPRSSASGTTARTG